MALVPLTSLKTLPSILVVEDDAFYTKRLSTGVVAKFTVCKSVDESLVAIATGEFDSAAIDLMLPYGENSGSARYEIEFGGVMVAAAFHEKWPKKRVAIMTQADPEDSNWRAAKRYLAPERATLRFFHKSEFAALSIFLDTGVSAEWGQDSVLGEFWKQLTLEPGVAGVKINLKKLVEKIVARYRAELRQDIQQTKIERKDFLNF